jgi:branched-chain amino acid transport system permease protein
VRERSGPSGPGSAGLGLLRSAPKGPILLAVALYLIGALVTRQDWLLQGAVALTYAIAATGLGLALGLAGEFLLGQLALFAVSAYVTAVLLRPDHGWAFWPAAAAGTLSATLVGLVLSVVGLRVSRFYFALVGFFLVALIPNIVEIFNSQTGGSAGLAVTTLPRLGGGDFGQRELFWLAGFFLILALLLVRNVRESPLGVHMRRMRENPVTLMSSGMPIWRVRLATYVLSSILAGVGGAIYCELFAYVLPNFFDLTATILLFAAVLVGGATTLLGPSLGVILLYVFPRIVIDVQGYSDLIYGGIVLISVIAFRGGVESTVARFVHRLRKRVATNGSRAEEAWAVDMAEVHPTGLLPGDEPNPELPKMLWGLRDGVKSRGTLVVRGAKKNFGGVKALDIGDDETVSVAPGQVHLLLGPNGSGKTTLLNATSGLARLHGGSVTFGDEDITNRGAARIARMGVSRSFQGPSLPAEISPRELLGALLAQLRGVSYVHWLTSNPIAARTRREARAEAGRILDAAGLGDAADQPCESLTSGQLRVLDVLIALTSRSTIVMLDEPAAGLSETERKQLGATIRALAKHGVGFLVVEHDLELALGMADHVTVLGQGRILASGSPDHIKEHPQVREVLIGASA